MFLVLFPVKCFSCIHLVYLGCTLMLLFLYVILLRCFMPLLGKVSFEWSAFLSERVLLDP